MVAKRKADRAPGCKGGQAGRFGSVRMRLSSVFTVQEEAGSEEMWAVLGTEE